MKNLTASEKITAIISILKQSDAGKSLLKEFRKSENKDLSQEMKLHLLSVIFVQATYDDSYPGSDKACSILRQIQIEIGDDDFGGRFVKTPEMKPEPLYLVVRYGGEYPDTWENVIAGSDDKETCEEFIKTQKLEDERLIHLHTLIGEFRNDYHSKNEHPSHFQEEYKEIPKWPAGLGMDQISPEMRAQRDEIVEYNRTLAEKYSEENKAYTAKYKLALYEFLKKEFNVSDEDIQVLESYNPYYIDKPKYEIREVRML